MRKSPEGVWSDGTFRNRRFLSTIGTEAGDTSDAPEQHHPQQLPPVDYSISVQDEYRNETQQDDSSSLSSTDSHGHTDDSSSNGQPTPTLDKFMPPLNSPRKRTPVRRKTLNNPPQLTTPSPFRTSTETRHNRTIHHLSLRQTVTDTQTIHHLTANQHPRHARSTNLCRPSNLPENALPFGGKP